MLEGAEEGVRSDKPIEVVVLELCHLQLYPLRLLKVSILQIFGALAQELQYVSIVVCKN